MKPFVVIRAVSLRAVSLGVIARGVLSLSLLACVFSAIAAEPAATADRAPTQATKKPTTASGASKPANSDQLTLDTTLVTGNRELPKVMYIVPWKKADLGELPGQPFNTLLDEALAPVDREVFMRQVNYYQVVSGKDQPTSAAGPTSKAEATPSADTPP